MDGPLKKAKEKAAASYNAAADHFDDEPLKFWGLIGERHRNQSEISSRLESTRCWLWNRSVGVACCASGRQRTDLW